MVFGKSAGVLTRHGGAQLNSRCDDSANVDGQIHQYRNYRHPRNQLRNPFVVHGFAREFPDSTRIMVNSGVPYGVDTTVCSKQEHILSFGLGSTRQSGLQS